jgi:hypothetical protein
MKRILSLILIILVSISGFAFTGLIVVKSGKIVPEDWQHWKSGGAHLDLNLTSNGFLVNVIKAGVNVHDLQVYSNNDLQIEKDKHYIARFKVKSNKNDITFISRLGSESEERNYFLRVVKIDTANKAELKAIPFDQKGDLIKFLKLYFELGQVDPGTTIEVTDAEIVEE